MMSWGYSVGPRISAKTHPERLAWKPDSSSSADPDEHVPARFKKLRLRRRRRSRMAPTPITTWIAIAAVIASVVLVVVWRAVNAS